MGRVVINEAALREVLTGPRSVAVRTADRLGRQITNLAKANAPVDDGRLRGSIGYTVRVEGSRVILTVGSPLKYALYRHNGTGIYGPRHARIYPKNGKVLRFTVKGGPRGPMPQGHRRPRGRVVFARSVRGVPANPFLYDALRAVLAGTPGARVHRTTSTS